ncbi:TBC1 domain family member 22B [Phlebotomus argentipes]|uniref:TBC1 domain family member 22B n=1 Tax=Phlebotomus argentipes TaxID=94469 RepID=UPI0028930CF9|nr:TBC1 domain family member 22B [Phlebotomus argentipes]
MDNNHESFWRHNSRAVPGKTVAATVKSKSQQMGSTSFQDFQESVRDAWELGDDEFCIMSGIGDGRASKRSAGPSAALTVKTHRSNLGRAPDVKPAVQAPPQNHTQESNNVPDDLINELSLVDDAISRERASSEPRKRYRQFHTYPGRPQLLKLSSSCLSKDENNESKLEKFTVLLEEPLLNLIALKQLSWSGIPKKMRPVTWRLLSGYLPTSLERRNSVLERKRLDYHKLVSQYFPVDSRDEAQQDTYHQIHIDVPRMNPHVPLFQQHLVQEMFERILFIWAIRHPASGYVQGINDLVTPFFIIFLQETLDSKVELETFKLEDLSEEQRNIIEADSFWCLSKFLDCIQDNYIFAQLGIQAKVNHLKELIQRIDGNLHKHLVQHGVDYLQFSFRWMNNLLTRELPLHCTIRLWDTYLAESDGFAVFQLYVCAAFLLHWREQLLQEKDFQGLMLMLQNLPTHNWMDSHISILVAEAFRLKFTYADAPKHFEGKS